MERETGFEPATSTLARLHSTTELLPLKWRRRPDLNRRWRFCRPLPYHLATSPYLCWSGRRDLNPRLQPWQGCTLPLSYSRSTKRRFTVEPRFCQALFLKKHIFLFHLFRMPLNMSRMLFLCREPSGGAFFRIRHQKRGSGRPSVAMPVLEAADQASVGNH